MERRLAAILMADVVGYDRLMETDEAGTLAALRERRTSILDPTVRAHGEARRQGDRRWRPRRVRKCGERDGSRDEIATADGEGQSAAA